MNYEGGDNLREFVFGKFKVTFVDNDRLDKLSLCRKLAYMANHDGMVSNSGIFSYVNRSDFPVLFERAIAGESFQGLELKDVSLRKQRIDFLFCAEGKPHEAFKVGVSLSGTSGTLDMKADGDIDVHAEWANGVIIKADRKMGRYIGQIKVPN